jgi:FRG domain
MQHYGAPTRLLDWSDGALVALYFAVASRGGEADKYGTADAVVYMIDPRWLNELAFKEVCPAETPYRAGAVAFYDWGAADRHLPDEGRGLVVSCPIPVDPSHLSRRIAAQRSRFMIFGREPDRLKKLADHCAACKIAKFDVEYKAIPEIKRDLKLAGISESTIFPDLEGLGRELSNWFQDNCNMLASAAPACDEIHGHRLSEVYPLLDAVKEKFRNGERD